MPHARGIFVADPALLGFRRRKCLHQLQAVAQADLAQNDFAVGIEFLDAGHGNLLFFDGGLVSPGAGRLLSKPLSKPLAVSTSREGFFTRGRTAMLDAAVKAISQILSPPMRYHPVALDRAGAGADHGAGHRLAAAVELVCRVRRSLGRGDAGAGLPHDAQHAGLDHLDRGRPRRRPRRHFPDAGGHLADRERVRRRRRRACRARALSGGAPRRRAAARRRDSGRHQDRAADHPGLSDRAALRAVRRRRLL